MNRYYGDSAYTYEVGEVSNTIKDLLTRTKESLYKGIEQAVSGNRLGDIGFYTKLCGEIWIWSCKRNGWSWNW